ncbi:putative hydrolase of the HAD superfamily [Murinocardiopsis flavida]|uniref:Putative hydrolase of the HAD superfamily n=1 Tax=Murinocardiopsis flavida TaxID=645275 RepID=A0A2P8DTV2_9ACTN|nr:HAD family phosphatase [Murinocardiopsis flavida]PSL00648.1 putative hydrolase of the HAD superfamily [Murinocardiopsis flavida]
MNTDLGHGAPSPLTTVVFDYGEVISQRPGETARDGMERIAGVPAPEFWRAYWAERRDYDAGISEAEYWGRVAAGLDRTFDADTVRRLSAADTDSWSTLSPGVTDLIARLAARGVRLALLSNAPHAMAESLRRSTALTGFEALFFSCELGLCKPDPAIYEQVLGALGSTPEQIAFIDDREDNILAAKRLGIDAHHYEDPTGLEAFLTDRFGPL